MQAGKIGLVLCALVLLISGAAVALPRDSESYRRTAERAQERRPAPRWSAPQQVVPESRRTGFTHVAFDAAGNTYLTVAGSGRRHPGAGYYDREYLRIPRVFIRPTGSRHFGKPERLSSQRAGELDMAVAANGAAVAL